MILLDTHIWIWWVQDDARLPVAWRKDFDSGRHELGVSVISCWEVAKLARKRRVKLPVPTDVRLAVALGYPSVHLLPLTPEIAEDSTNLPGGFASDPADEIIVSTAESLQCELATMDRLITGYAHVRIYK